MNKKFFIGLFLSVLGAFMSLNIAFGLDLEDPGDKGPTEWRYADKGVYYKFTDLFGNDGLRDGIKWENTGNNRVNVIYKLDWNSDEGTITKHSIDLEKYKVPGYQDGPSTVSSTTRLYSFKITYL